MNHTEEREVILLSAVIPKSITTDESLNLLPDAFVHIKQSKVCKEWSAGESSNSALGTT